MNYFSMQKLTRVKKGNTNYPMDVIGMQVSCALTGKLDNQMKATYIPWIEHLQVLCAKKVCCDKTCMPWFLYHFPWPSINHKNHNRSSLVLITPNWQQMKSLQRKWEKHHTRVWCPTYLWTIFPTLKYGLQWTKSAILAKGNAPFRFWFCITEDIVSLTLCRNLSASSPGSDTTNTSFCQLEKEAARRLKG